MSPTALPSPGDGSDGLASSFAASYAGVLAVIAVAAEGSFARAGDRLGIGRSAISRNVQRLEAQLGVRLFHRTTRSMSLTSEGQLFLAGCRPGVSHIAQALEDMRELRQGPPQGHLRVGSAVAFGRKVVAPLLQGFNAAYPDISIELLLGDSRLDLVADRIDVAFCNGRMEDSQVVAKQLMPMHLLVCASPAYARERGLPQTVQDLANHRSVNLRLPCGRVREWEFRIDGRVQRLLPPARNTFNDDDVVLQAVLDGEGLGQLAGFQVDDCLRAGQIVSCLQQFAPEEGGHHVFFSSRRQLPSRIRVFIDYMTLQIRSGCAPAAQDLVCSSEPLPSHP